MVKKKKKKTTTTKNRKIQRLKEINALKKSLETKSDTQIGGQNGNVMHTEHDKFKMDPINDNDKTYEKCEYHNKNLNELGMNDANRAYKNRLNKTQINLNKSLKNIEINN